MARVKNTNGQLQMSVEDDGSGFEDEPFFLSAELERRDRTLEHLDFRSARNATELDVLSRSVSTIPIELDDGREQNLTRRGLRLMVETVLYENNSDLRLRAFDAMPEISGFREAVVMLPEATLLRQDLAARSTQESQSGGASVVHAQPARRALDWARERFA